MNGFGIQKDIEEYKNNPLYQNEDGSPNMSTSIILEAGKSFVLGTVHDGIATSDANATIVTSLVDLESILMNPGANAIEIEVFVASIADA